MSIANLFRPLARAAAASVLLGLGALAQAAPFTYHTYNSMVADLTALEAAFPQLAELTTAQSQFGLPNDGSSGQWQQYIMRITNESTGLDKPEVLLVGVQHGDEIVSLEVGVETARILLEQYGQDPWITALVDRREIYIMPLANPDGFDRGVRGSRGDEGNNEDMNRDHLYDRCSFFCSDDEPLSTIGARAIHELSKRHLFRVMVDYHGGTELIIYPWGTPLHNGNTESPDEAIADALGNRMRTYGGSFRGLYPVGTSNDLLGAVNAPLDDTAYATSWDPGNADSSFPTDGWRAVAYTVEISNAKQPSQNLLGGDADILTTDGAEDGYVPKNVRIALATIDIAEPWVEWTNRASIPSQVAAGDPVQVQWMVRGCFEVNDTRVRWGTDADPRLNFTSQSASQSDTSSQVCFDTPTQFSATVTFPSEGNFFLTPVARVDDSTQQQGNPTPNIPPQTWLARVRAEEGLLFTNSTDPSEVNTVRGQVYWGAEPLAIEVTGGGGGGYVVSAPTPGLAGQSNTFVVTGATPGANTILVAGLNSGATPVPGCPGQTVGVANLNILGSVPADGSGTVTFTRNMPAFVSGRQVIFQAVELSTCSVSTAVNFMFP